MSKVDAKACRKRTEHAKAVPNLIGGQLDKEKRERAKYEEKVRKANDPEEIKKTTLNKIYQLKAIAEKEAGMLIVENCKKLKQDIYEFLTEGVERNASYTILEEKINLCLGLLKEYRSVVENDIINERAQGLNYTLYEQLFNMLIDYNAKFLMFAPKGCFKRTVAQSKINTLSETYQKAVQERIERLEEDEQADYVNEYMVCEIEPNEKTEKVDEMTTFLNNTKDQAVDKMVAMTDNVGLKLYNFITSEYDEIKNGNGEVGSKDIQKIFFRCKRERDMLKSLIRDNQLISSKMKERKFNTNENMFNHLINLDIRFAQYAPGKCYCRLDLDFKTLTEEEKDIVFDRIYKYGLWNIPQIVETYHSVFACQIAKKGNGFNQ